MCNYFILPHSMTLIETMLSPSIHMRVYCLCKHSECAKITRSHNLLNRNSLPYQMSLKILSPLYGPRNCNMLDVQLQVSLLTMYLVALVIQRKIFCIFFLAFPGKAMPEMFSVLNKSVVLNLYYIIDSLINCMKQNCDNK